MGAVTNQTTRHLIQTVTETATVRSPFVLFLLLGPALDHHHVDVLEEDHGARHEQLVGVRLHLELLGLVGQVRHPVI